MNKLINKCKEVKRTKKGFTLVELLVVIAILAVLASVSVIGYLGFVEKARNSDAVTELAQVRELLRAELIDGEDHKIGGDSGTVTMKYIDNKYYFLDLESPNAPTESAATIEETTALKKHSDLSSIPGKLYVVFSSTAANPDVGGESDKSDYEVVGMLYVRDAGGTANWVVSSDTISAGKGTYSVPETDTDN